MTSYAAYDAGMPCRNPSCSSRGQPHPNCRCYPNLMAEGGEVRRRCEGPHQPGCEHHLPTPASDQDDIAAAFAHGGAVGALKTRGIDEHIGAVRKGHARIRAMTKTLFDDPKALKPAAPDEKARERLSAYLENGGINQSLHDARHGTDTQPAGVDPLLEDNSIAAHYPAQNVMLQAARTAREAYLNGLRPEEHGLKLPFDDEPDQTEAKRKYHQALDLANDPLGVLPEMARGTLEADHVKHLENLSPELTDLLRRRLTEKVTEAQLKEAKPPYRVRQSLGLFLGANLSSELAPASVAAAQATFAGKASQQPPAPPAGKGKHSTAGLTKADQAFLTSSQARQSRDQKT